MASSVDLSGAIRFDLDSGAVHVGDDEKAVVVPAEVLSALVKGAGAQARSIGRELGTHIGRRVAKRAGGVGALLDAGLEHAATLLAAELALSGLGSCNLERWGKALVVHVTGTALPAEFVANLVEGALAAATGRSLGCALLVDDDGARVLVASEKGAERVRDWIAKGTAWSDAIARLQLGTGGTS
jgi:hypothetical protein